MAAMCCLKRQIASNKESTHTFEMYLLIVLIKWISHRARLFASPSAVAAKVVCGRLCAVYVP